MAINKVVYNGKTLIDLTGDTVTKDALFAGVTAHDQKGNLVTGTLFSGFPDKVYIYNPPDKDAWLPASSERKGKNLVNYDNKELINLTNDTVTEDTLLYGYSCHRKDGTMITGRFLNEWDNVVLHPTIEDQNNDYLRDSNGNIIEGSIEYDAYWEYDENDEEYIVYEKW